MNKSAIIALFAFVLALMPIHASAMDDHSMMKDESMQKHDTMMKNNGDDNAKQEMMKSESMESEKMTDETMDKENSMGH